MPQDLSETQPPPWRIWDRGGQRPVLAMHCSLAHSGAWSGLAERLSGITLTALDQPGHGRAADWDGREEIHALTTRLAAQVARRIGGGGPVDLIGHSFGGTVCLRLALENPRLVRSLVLVEPVIFAAAKGHAAFAPFCAQHLGIAALLAGGDRVAAAAEFHGHWGSGAAYADLAERPRAYITARIHHIGAQTPVLLEDAAGMLRPDGLEALTVPVLLIEGADSPAIIAAVQSALAARLRHARRLVVPGAGHMVPITHPEAVALAVQAHLDGC